MLLISLRFRWPRLHRAPVDALTRLYAAGCRVLIEPQGDGAYLRISRPGAALHSASGDAYTLHIRARTLEEALDQAVVWVGEGKGYAVEQAERHEGEG